MIVPTLARRLRAQRVDFGPWRGRGVTATEDDLRHWHVDHYGAELRADDIVDGLRAGYGRLRGALLRLELFPIHLVELFPDATDGRATRGTSVLERIYVGPIGFTAAVRLVDIRDDGPDGSRVAVTWATVDGHPERGIETFAAELHDDSLLVTIEARSRPASLQVRLVSPVARWLQRRYSRASVAHLSAMATGVDGRAPTG